MRIGYRWLQELVDFEWEAEELCERLTMAGVACEVTGGVFQPFSGVVVGKVKNVQPHPSQKNITVCQVDIGLKTVTTICGAPNVSVGLKSPFATSGAVLPGGLKVETVEKYDIKSEGMLCSEKELGLTDDGSILMELDPGLKTGADLWQKQNLDEPLIEFELTPNRPDCMSAVGVAREIAALTGSRLKKPEFTLEELELATSDKILIKIDNPEACPRYSARFLEISRVASSPFWLKRKLIGAGVRPINNIVDITNLVLMEIGHPLHAFDFDLFSMPQVLVRSAHDGEKFTTLDDIEHEMKEGDIMITDSSQAVALGGIMGGKNSEVNDNTKNILLESAYFNPASICHTRKRLNIDSESAIRFEKGADPNIVDFACDYAASLMADIAGAKVYSGIVDNYARKITPVEIELRPPRVNQVLATDISTPEMIDILNALEFKVQTGKTISVEVPTFRPDCTREIDLIEEIARIYGYDKIQTSLRAAGDLITERRKDEILINGLRENLTRQGLYEILTNNMIDPEKAFKIGMEDKFVRIVNPLSSDLSAYRTNLLVNTLQVVLRNLHQRQKDIKIFEIGNIAYKTNGNQNAEETHLSIGICGEPEIRSWAWQPGKYDFFDLKGTLEDLAKNLNFEKVSFKLQNYPYFKDGASFDLQFGETIVGIAGEVNDKALKVFDIDYPVYFLEINVEKLQSLFDQKREFKQLPRYPSVWRDIAVIVDNNVLAEDLLTSIMTTGKDLLVNAELFDVYTGKQIEKNKKSLAYNLKFRSDSKTLTDEEVEPVFNNIIQNLNEKFDAKLRT